MSHGKWKCLQKDKLKVQCGVCGKDILLHPLLEPRRGRICPNCLRKKTNLERFGMEEPPKNVRKEDLLKFKEEMEALKDTLSPEEYARTFAEKIEYLKANTPQALHLLEWSPPSLKKRPHRFEKWQSQHTAAVEIIKERYPETIDPALAVKKRHKRRLKRKGVDLETGNISPTIRGGPAQYKPDKPKRERPPLPEGEEYKPRKHKFVRIKKQEKTS